MALWSKGYEKDIGGKKAKTDRRFSILNQTVYYRDLETYMDEEFWECVDIWNEYKTFNRMPFDGGYKNQPWIWIELIKTMENIWQSLRKN